ncbi:MAG TPA: hypothetical protein VN700_06260 [Vicinamibacterales bacterium]|nr:hypothetical protein [Vicinamibacterales bacterium]
MRLLIRFFFVRLFDFELTAESRSGSASLSGIVAGTAGIFLTVGAWLLRVFTYRYNALRETRSEELFQAAALTDHTFLLAAMMWIVGMVAVLTGPSLFPDETDFRVMTPMPVKRRVIFGAKLAALGLFAGLFFAFALVSSLPLFLMSSIGRLASPSWAVQLPAFLAASLLAVLFAALGVAAVHALILLAVPRERLLPISAALGSTMLCALVMALPFVGRIPSIKEALDNGATWLYFFPPAWFLGVERWLGGDARFASLASIGAGALLLAAAIAAAAYVALYRDFSRVMTRPASDQGLRLGDASVAHVRPSRRPAFTAVRAFTSATLARSVLHQGVFIAVFAIGAAVVTSRLFDLDFSPATLSTRLRSADTLIGAPFALSFMAILAARASLVLPIEIRANWIFRFTEDPKHRGAELDAAISSVVRLGVVLPAVLLLPFQWAVLGPASLVTSFVAALCAWVLAEALLIEWRRIPFTCSYTIGTAFIPQIVLLGLLLYVGYSTVGSALALGSIRRSPVFGVTVCIILSAIALGIRRHRRWCAGVEPLQFEDVLPTESSPLRLTVD